MTMKVAVALICIVCMFLPDTPTCRTAPMWTHLTYHFTHANIFHLLANLYVLWTMRRVRWVPAYLISTLISLIPATEVAGLSGLIFASYGVSCGIRNRLRTLLTLAVFAIVWGLFPGVSLTIHILSLLIGFAYGYISVWLAFR